MAIGQYLGIIGSVVGGIIGGVIGSYFPGVGTAYGAMLGASIGGMIGGVTGQVFYPEKYDLNLPPPPQPHENRFQVSTYGAAIPIVYESARLAGNIIYMSPINNTVVRTSHRQDGVRYYEITQTYTCTFAVAFCEGEVEGISRIWLNSKVFADYRDPAGPYYPSGSVALASANLETSIARQAAYFSIYLGTESQTADTNISSLITAAENPAYRGICYIVFIDFPIGEFSGLPNVEVEIGPQVSADECSEYFDMANGALMSDVLQIVTNNGYTPTIEGNKLKFIGTVAGEAIRTTFKFTEEFDVSIEFDLNIYLGIQDGFVYFGLVDATATIPDNGSHWTDTAITFNWMPARKYYESSDDIDTSDTTGKLRIRRDSSNNIYVYYWNNSLSQWEWDGDTNGVLMETNGDPVSPQISVYIGDGSTVFIDCFITASGCDSITV